jgi:ribosomal-protein-alanine N-acetyltransferase
MTMNRGDRLTSLLPPIAVREFELPDALAVEEILRKSPEAAVWSLRSIEQLKQRGELAWVVESDGAIRGFLVTRAVMREAEILNLSVHPAKRRAGLATLLLQEAMAEFQSLGVAKIFLEVRESNAAAIAFYGTQGFVKEGLRPRYYRDPDEGALLMTRAMAIVP